VLALLRDPGERNTSNALGAGATGVVPYDAAEDELVTAVQDTAVGRRHLSPALLRPRHSTSPRFALLSSREREVFTLIAKGLNNRQIGQVLFISPKTVDTHRGKIYEKLGAHSAADIVHAAYRDGIIST
jgi:DNA-binding NarL/FixJ family response regulator